MAAARSQSSYTEINFSNSRRSVPTQAQWPIIAVPSKSPRGVVKQQNIPQGYDPVGAPTRQLDQPSKDYCPDHDWSWSGFTSKKGLPIRTGLNRTGKGKFDQKRHNYVDELQNYVDKLQNRETAYSLSVPQNDSKRFWANPQLRRDLTVPESSFPDHISRSGLWPDGPGYENITPKSPFTITDKELEMLLPLGRTKSSLHEQLDVEVKGIQAGLAMFEAKFFGLNVRQRAIYQPTNDRHSRKGRYEKWSNNVRFCDNGSSSKGIFTGRLDNQVDTLFFPKKMSFLGPYNSKSSAEIGESDLLSHCVSKETIAPGELDLFGRDWIRRWKDGPGRNKDWRSSRYLKSMRKGERAKYQLSSLGRRSCSNPSKATNNYLAITQFPPHIAVPKDMLRQKSTSCQGHSSYLGPKSSWQAMNEAGLNKKTNFLRKSRARCEPSMTGPMDSLDIEEARRSNDRLSADSEVSNATIDDLLTAMVSTYTETSSPKFKTPNAKRISLNHLLAPESFVDTMLGACLRLKRLLRTESHYEVYDAESLSDRNQKYEARAYNLRGLSLKVRNYKIRNLKRASARSSCIGSLEQGGKKWLVFADAGADLVPEPFGDCGPLWSTRDEYERAFPVLEPHKPDTLEKTEKEALQDGVVIESYEASFAKALEEELLKRLDTYQTLEVIDRLRERLVASFQPCHHDDKLTPMSEKRKESKSPGQAKRLRDRQRLSRQTRRKAKALKTGATSDSMPQTLDMTSGPPTEAVSENECNHVATNHTIDAQTQEDFEKPWSYCIDTTYNPFAEINQQIARLEAHVNAMIDMAEKAMIDTNGGGGVVVK